MVLRRIRQRLAPWHRRLAWLVVLPVLAWSLSGLLHPVMSRWQPSAAAMMVPPMFLAPPADTAWSDFPSPNQTLPADWQMREVRAVTWQDQPYWQVQLSDGSVSQVHAKTGEVVDLTQDIVTHLARHYTGEQRAAVSLSVVNEFSSEYSVINRYLPVYRVAFDRPDGLIAFVEPRSLQLAGLTDDWKTQFGTFFRAMHNWSWWPHAPSRAWVMAGLLSLALIVAVSGIVRAWPSSVKRRKPHVWHRRIGLVVALAAFAWFSTGALHALVMNSRVGGFQTYPLVTYFTADQLAAKAPSDVPEGARLQIVSGPNGPLWYWHQLVRAATDDAHAHHGHSAPRTLNAAYFGATNGEPVQAERYWAALAQPVAGQAHLLSVKPITGFFPEYGFVQKRLPVQQLTFHTADNLTVYVDPADAAVASVVRDLDRVEGLSFAYLHKVQFLDPIIGKDARDAVAGVFAAMIFSLTLMGLWMLRRRTLRND
ncbi:MAG: PepSY domain-containing protein [Moraxellaceae bacterium]|nr:PepSY domain-containing protein [Moraxellaceae bacterium]